MNERDIFDEAVNISDPAERSAYLDEVCNGDARLKEHIEGLVEANQKVGSFLNRPAAEVEATVQHSRAVARPGEMVGPYKLREQLGTGGFGVVWAAEQVEPIRRKVALKIIKPGMDTDTVVARFEAERQALALMEHPNIARVFDAGTTEHGRPYFVMELIRGVPITQYCDENRLTVHQRLALFVEVCRAVQHAHHKGIIHRDVKPSNVLVTLHDGAPVPKVIDFGIAKALSQRLTEKTIYTRVHQAIGTLAYMSPEAAELSGLDMDTRADIYGLGVLLYELLTGTTPFDKKRLGEAALHEACRIIREEEPPKASTRLTTLGETATALSLQRNTDPRDLTQLVHGDLDWILVKSLEKDRTRRYESASAFASDVQRYLNSEPIEARPPSNWYRLRKYSRRHRGLVAGVSAVLAILIVTSAVATSFGIVAVNEAQEKKAALVVAQHERKKAVASRDAAQHEREKAVAALAVARREQRKAEEALSSLRTTLFEQGVDYILAANEKEAKRVKDRLEKMGARDLAVKLQVIMHLHNHNYSEAVQLLESAVTETAVNPDDAGLLALLANAYSGSGDMIKWWELNQRLSLMDHDGMTPVERVYAARAFIIHPEDGYKLADEAVTQRPGSPIARLTRGELLAEWALRGRHPERTDEAVKDVDSVHWLLGSDKRFPAIAIVTCVTAANASRAAGEPNWNRHFETVRDVVDYVENKGPSYWEMIPLAHYYNSLEQQDKASSLLCMAARNLQDDYVVNQYLALTVELNEQPDTEIVARFQHGELKAFGLAGFGYLRAIEGKVHEAAKVADRIVQQNPGSADALVLAADVLRMAGKSHEAQTLVREHIESVSGPGSFTALEWVRDTLLPYYAEDWEDQELISRCETESDSGSCLSGAYWEIGLKRFAENDIEGARENFRKCVEQRIYFLHAHLWSCAMLKWIERRYGDSRDRASLGGEPPANKSRSSSN